MAVGCLIIAISVMAPMTSEQIPVIFTRGGETVSLETDLALPAGTSQLTLKAYGQTWTASRPATLPATTPAIGPATLPSAIQVPEVERLTVFSVIEVNAPYREVGQIVAYPPLSHWKDKPLIIYGLAVPTWFRQWAHATSADLIETDLKGLKSRTVSTTVLELVVIGAKTAGNEWSEVCRLSDQCGIDVLVLEADWFGPAHGRAIEVEPGQMRGRLEELRLQRWRRPLSFTDCREPWPGIVNRRLWIENDGVPLLEQVGPLVADRRIVLSYLPWARQLGRNDLADDLLEYVLRAVADSQRPAVTMRPLRVLDAVRRTTGDDSADKDILDAAVRSLAPELQPADALRVIDLRGPQSPSDELLKAMSVEGEHVDQEHPLLILGDDPILDDCRWLELDRRKTAVIKPVGAAWVPDDVWPPLSTAQVKAMIAITDFGVLIEDPPKEKPS